jgi:hypothetical protein
LPLRADGSSYVLDVAARISIALAAVGFTRKSFYVYSVEPSIVVTNAVFGFTRNAGNSPVLDRANRVRPGNPNGGVGAGVSYRIAPMSDERWNPKEV